MFANTKIKFPFQICIERDIWDCSYSIEKKFLAMWKKLEEDSMLMFAKCNWEGKCKLLPRVRDTWEDIPRF